MRFFLPLLIALSACTQFPELDGTIAPDQTAAPFPNLVPLGPLIAQAGVANNAAAAMPPTLSPRLANLRARATRLRGPVIPAPVRTRMLLRGVR